MRVRKASLTHACLTFVYGMLFPLRVRSALLSRLVHRQLICKYKEVAIRMFFGRYDASGPLLLRCAPRPRLMRASRLIHLRQSPLFQALTSASQRSHALPHRAFRCPTCILWAGSPERLAQRLRSLRLMRRDAVKTNTVKCRLHSLFRQGRMLYDLMPTIREEWLGPAMQRFSRMLQKPISLPPLVYGTAKFGTAMLGIQASTQTNTAVHHLTSLRHVR
jgi:hypothetical protein